MIFFICFSFFLLPLRRLCFKLVLNIEKNFLKVCVNEANLTCMRTLQGVHLMYDLCKSHSFMVYVILIFFSKLAT